MDWIESKSDYVGFGIVTLDLYWMERKKGIFWKGKKREKREEEKGEKREEEGKGGEKGGRGADVAFGVM